MAAPLDMEPSALSLELLPTDPLLLILSFLDYGDLMRQKDMNESSKLLLDTLLDG